MSVEGVSKSAIARIKGISWNTVARWLEKAARFARRFNSLMTRGYELIELQADEIRTFILRKKCPVWVFLSIEVWSRLWPSTVIGRRSYRNARALMAETAHRGQFERPALITRLCIHRPVIARLFGYACLYGQVIKTWRNNRVHSVDRKLMIGSN